MDLSTIHILGSGDHHRFMQTLFERIHLLWTYRQPPKSCLAALASNYAAIADISPRKTAFTPYTTLVRAAGLVRQVSSRVMVRDDNTRRLFYPYEMAIGTPIESDVMIPRLRRIRMGTCQYRKSRGSDFAWFSFARI